jgi:hypothetical protein
MDDALVTVAPTGTKPEGSASPVGNSTPQQPKEPASRWKQVRLGRKSAVSEVLGTAEGPAHGVMRVYEATIEYHLVSLGDDVKLDRPEKIYRYMADILEKFPMNETLWVVLLNRKGKAIARHLCTSGTLTGSLVHPREVFRPAFLAGASSVVVVHNHPSGDSNKQKLELTWIGKENRPKLEPRILLGDEEKAYHAKHRVGDNDIFDNRLIFGDNLLALKALEQEFTGKIRCVFIDPPYNTGSAFEHYDDGIEHSLWLGMMRDRLELLKRLLREDGSIWITIDDNEAHYLKVLCDEVFGRNCFITSLVWRSTDNSNNDAKQFSVIRGF